MAGAPKRLSKVAKELNVGISTLVEFLSSKGFDDNAKPNTKIDDSTYEAMLSEFMPDKAAKEKSQELKKNRVVRETITLEDQSRDEDDTVAEDTHEEVLVQETVENPVVAQDADNTLAATKDVQPEPKQEDEKPVDLAEPVAEQNQEVTTAPEPEVIAEEPAPASVEEKPVKSKAPEVQPVEASSEEGDGPQVLGKIDLDSLNLKTRPSKKPKKKPEPAKQAPKQKAEKPAPKQKESPKAAPAPKD